MTGIAMNHSSTHNAIEAQCNTGMGLAKIVRQCRDRPIDVQTSPHQHHLQLALFPQSPSDRASYPEVWSPKQFEPLGSLFFFPAGCLAHIRSDSHYQRSIICTLDPQAVECWLEQYQPWSESHLRGFLSIKNRNIHTLLCRLGEEIRSPGFACESMVEFLMGQVIIELARHAQDHPAPYVTGGLSARQLRLIDERIAETGSPPTLSELASLCGVSVRHLSRAFYNSRGESAGAYIARQRIERAKQLMASGMNIKAVAYTLGFSAPSNFTTAFVRATGQTPSQYRHKL